MKKVLFFVTFFVVMSLHAQTTMTSQQWQDDLKYLQETVHNDYPFLFKKTTKEDFDAEVAKLHQAIPNLQSHEVIVGLARIVSMFKYGHTDISFRQEPFTFRNFPFNLYSYSDGIYIQGVHKSYANTLGAKVIAINKVNIDDALKMVEPVVPVENSQYFKAFGINYLRIPEVLHAQGITSSLSENVILTMEKDGSTFEQEFKALPKGERLPVRYSHVFQDDNWLEARDQSATPYYLKNIDKRYYFEYLPEMKAVYVRQSSVFDDEAESIADFYGRVFDFIDSNDVEKLVIDVRLNGGGNNYKNKPVITGLIQSEKINKVGNLFVILGRRTFSACQNLVNEMSNYTNAIFIGEPTSENINFYGDNRTVALPNSKIPIFLSFAWWQDKPQWENADWLAPHIAVDMTYDQYASNEDPVLDTALNFAGSDFITNPMQHFTNLFTTGQIDKLRDDAISMVNDERYKFFDFEGEFNRAGYNLLSSSRSQEAIFVFTMVTQLFPNSANAWDSLAEGYLKAGDKVKAKEYYNKAISMDPDGPAGKNAKEMLRQMESGNH